MPRSMALPTSSPARAAPTLGEFAQRVAIVLLIGALAYAVWRLAALALLLFAAVLFAIALRSGARWIAGHAPIGITAALGLVVIAVVAALGGSLWFFGAVAAGQLDELARQVPAGLRVLIGQIEATEYGHYAIAQLRIAGIAGASGWIARTVSTLAQALVLGLGSVVLTFCASVYLAAQPDRYRQMCLRVLPAALRPRVALLFARSIAVLRQWMAGQVLVMLLIGVASELGLWALGIEAALALGMVGGLLTFIPYVGAILAAVPATLIALTQSPAHAAVVLAMYGAIHFVEGNFVTPLVQSQASALPPVLALLGTVGITVLFGASAVLLAAPLTLLVLVAIDVLWVEAALA